MCALNYELLIAFRDHFEHFFRNKRLKTGPLFPFLDSEDVQPPAEPQLSCNQSTNDVMPESVEMDIFQKKKKLVTIDVLGAADKQGPFLALPIFRARAFVMSIARSLSSLHSGP